MQTIRNSISTNTLLKISPILLLPFGAIFQFKVNTSILDLAAIFAIFSAFLFNVNKFVISFLVIFIYSFFLYLFNSDNLINYNLQRLIYSSILFAPYICLALGSKIEIKAIYLYKLKKYLYIMSFLIAVVSILTHYQIIIVPRQYLLMGRPLFPFDEPSRLGLYLVAITLGFYPGLTKVSNFSYVKSVKFWSYLLIIVLLLWAAILTKTTHITFTFGVIILIFSYKIEYFFKSNNQKNKIINKLIRNITLIAVTIVIIFMVILLSDRLDFIVLRNANLNLSELSWLNGMESALRSIKNSPFWGFGLGALGNLTNYEKTIYAQRTYEILGSYLNLLDGYSMTFRLVHDLGLVPFLFLIFYIIKNALKNFNSNKNNFVKEEISIFYLLIGFALLLGSLIKEPTASHALIALGPYLLMLKVI